MVSLEQPVPVYLLYLSAFVRDGEVQFRNDPYGKDRRATRRLGALVAEAPSVCEEVDWLLGWSSGGYASAPRPNWLD